MKKPSPSPPLAAHSPRVRKSGKTAKGGAAAKGKGAATSKGKPADAFPKVKKVVGASKY